MLKKHYLLFGTLIGIALLIIATTKYPGGSQQDAHSVGFSWRHNYASNLFENKAVNGAGNPAKGWATAGMLFLCSAFALFYVRYAKLIPHKSGARVITYCGIASMLFIFLTVTPYHDLMLVFSSVCGLLCTFYITIFLLKTKLHFFKIFSILLLVLDYTSNYLFFVRQVEWLPVMQKISTLASIIWMLNLYYCTDADDFKKINVKSEDNP